MSRFKSKKGVALLATLVVVLAAAVGGYAYFTNTGDSGPTTPVTVATVPLTGTFTIADGTVTGGALEPTAIGDHNQVVDTVPFTITNTSEANELLTSYTITLSGSQTTSPHAACDSSDFAVNGVAYTVPVVVTAGGTPALPVELLPASDNALTPNNVWSGHYTIQLVDEANDQDSCMGFQPTVDITATS